MTTEPTADELRAIAEHRGMKLVRSRKRTPGVGDYGKFGLTDAADKPLLGIGEQGLTASAADIARYLRGGAADSGDTFSPSSGIAADAACGLAARPLAPSRRIAQARPSPACRPEPP